MRAVELHHPDPEPAAALRAVERPDPVPGPGQVVVEVDACAVCRTDLQLATGDLPARRLPVIPGHQVVGRIGATGSGVDPGRIGQQVGLVWLARTCGSCAFCTTGRENLCRASLFTGWDVDGGWAAMLPELLVKDAIADGRLESLEGPEQGKRAYWLVAPLPQWRQKKVKTLIDFLTA